MSNLPFRSLIATTQTILYASHGTLANSSQCALVLTYSRQIQIFIERKLKCDFFATMKRRAVCPYKIWSYLIQLVAVPVRYQVPWYLGYRNVVSNVPDKGTSTDTVPMLKGHYLFDFLLPYCRPKRYGYVGMSM